MKRPLLLFAVATILFMIGLSLMVGGFFYDVFYAGIPYQDPPPALQERYMQQKQIASLIRGTGLVTLLGGVALGVSSLLWRWRARGLIQ